MSRVSRKSYGTCCVVEELNEQGHSCGRDKPLSNRTWVSDSPISGRQKAASISQLS